MLVASVVLVLSAGCSRTESSPQPEAPSAWDQTLAEIGEDGKVSLTTALKAFALAIAPLPGVQVPAGKVDIFSGTIAINWVIAHWAELTNPQQSAVENALSGNVTPRGRAPYAGTGERPIRSAPAGPNVDCLTADAGDAAPFRAMIGPILADIATHLGPAVFANPDTNRRSEDFQLHVAVDTEQRVAARMYSIPCTGEVAAAVTDDPTSCSIHVTPEALKPEHSTNDRRAILIHELMHCVMHARLGAAYIDGSPWYWEGVPTWAMTVLGGGDAGSAKYARYT